ncbi:MAG TPA: dUTP diphosphatase [Patescibacteria group bacterium]|nr:dUTP diphosphatase [Patescibacteria group bacterium]
MQVKIKRIDTSLPLPEYKTAGAAAFDIYSREDCIVPARGQFKVPSNLIVATPPGYVLLIFSRSSLAPRKGLMLANSVGVIDSDYCGPTDEILVSVYNLTDQEVKIEKGERIAQGMFVKYEQGKWEETENVGSPDRGGFGSTGV